MVKGRRQVRGYYVVGDIAYGVSNKMSCEKATRRARHEQEMGRRVTVVEAYDQARARYEGAAYFERMDRLRAGRQAS